MGVFVEEFELAKANMMRDDVDTSNHEIDLITADFTPATDMTVADVTLLADPRPMATADWSTPAIESGKAVMRNVDGDYSWGGTATFASTSAYGFAITRDPSETVFIHKFSGGPITVTDAAALVLGDATRPIVWKDSDASLV